MYLGRMLACARAGDGSVYLYYRVHSRSFKNRELQVEDGKASVVPSTRHSEDFKNPYVTYNCCRHNQATCVVANGAQTDPIFEKLVRGASPRDAIAHVLLGMDYEFDGHDTPRIVMHACAESGALHFGIVTQNSLQVDTVKLARNQLALLSTNEYNCIDRQLRFSGYEAFSLDEAAEYLVNGAVFREHEHGVLGLTLALQKGFPSKTVLLSDERGGAGGKGRAG